VFDFIPIKSHMKRLFAKSAIAAQMTLRSDAVPADEPISSVWQTEAWKRKVVDSGFAGRFPQGLVLHLSADGTNPFIFGSYSIWPVYFELYNLPLNLRRQYGNICITAIVHGPKAPSSLRGVCEVIASELATMYENPVDVFDAHQQRVIQTGAMLFSVTGDLPGCNTHYL
jgi:hypothetical protein